MEYKIICFAIYCTIIMHQNVFASNSCELNFNSCEECIADPSKCVWCAEINFNGTRCRSERENLDDWCVGHTINPKSDKRSIQNKPVFNSKAGEVVQIIPQKIKMNIRPGDLIDFDFSIKLARNYPVDLYFLVHSSKLMRDVKQRIIDESLAMYTTMKNITHNVFFGTGTFIDKNKLPFTSLANNTVTYSFRNRLKLIDNYQEFQNAINNTWFGSNTDTPEGTLDALSQVITCVNGTGWRDESTKIIIVLTYGPFRSAGNANWVGLYRPYDGKCYSEDGIYENELKMDYPSVSIINRLAAEKEIIIVYMVEKNKEVYYKFLVNATKGSEVSIIKDENFSMVDVLKKQYQNIKQYLKLKVNIKDPTFGQYIKYSFDPDCRSESSLKECQIHIDEEKKFKGTITLLKNIEPDKIDIDILAKGIGEKLNLNIHIIKTCNCPVTENSTDCNSMGTLKCGKCECNINRRGKRCECDKKSTGVDLTDESACISPTSSDKIKCNGQGVCVCGECVCINKDYTGSYCQCHKNMCPQYNDLVCSDHGMCVCGDCICNPGFTGKDCRFSMARDNCMDGDTECNDRGACIYNNCVCTEPSPWDARRNGNLCQLKCSQKSCHSHQCQLLEPIVQCHLNQGACEPPMDVNITGLINFPGNYSAYDIANDAANYSDDTTANYTASHWYLCPNVKTGLGCYTAFLYRYNEDSYGIRIRVQTYANCAESYYKYGGICAVVLIVSGVIGLIMWKTVTSIRDKREYERFVEEVRIMGSPCENPLYAPTSRTYTNPGFRKRSDRRKFST